MLRFVLLLFFLTSSFAAVVQHPKTLKDYLKYNPSWELKVVKVYKKSKLTKHYRLLVFFNKSFAIIAKKHNSTINKFIFLSKDKIITIKNNFTVFVAKNNKDDYFSQILFGNKVIKIQKNSKHIFNIKSNKVTIYFSSIYNKPIKKITIENKTSLKYITFYKKLNKKSLAVQLRKSMVFYKFIKSKLKKYKILKIINMFLQF